MDLPLEKRFLALIEVKKYVCTQNSFTFRDILLYRQKVHSTRVLCV